MKNFFIKSLLVCMLCFGSFAMATEVNVNEANAEEISKALKGIGPKKAQMIIDYRTKHGPFKKLEDLRLVKGIGAKTLEKNKDLIKLSGVVRRR